MSFQIPQPTTGSPVNTRRLQDANYVVTTALGGNGVTTNATSMDMTQAVPYPITERILATVVTSGTVTIASTGTVAVQWQHSADNSTFVNIPELATTTLNLSNYATQLAAGGTNYIDQWQFPPTVQRYVRVVISQSSANVTGTGSIISALYF